MHVKSGFLLGQMLIYLLLTTILISLSMQMITTLYTQARSYHTTRTAAVVIAGAVDMLWRDVKVMEPTSWRRQASSHYAWSGSNGNVCWYLRHGNLMRRHGSQVCLVAEDITDFQLCPCDDGGMHIELGSNHLDAPLETTVFMRHGSLS